MSKKSKREEAKKEVAVRDVKGQELGPKVEKPSPQPDNKIQIHTGNVDVITIKVLESINNGVNGILKLLMEKKNG